MNIFSKKNKLEDELFNMKFTAKSLLRQAKKCEKNQAAHKAKLKKAIEQGNMEGARIYAQNVIREKNQALSYLQLASRIDAVASRVQTAISMGQLKSNMSGVVKGMDTVMESMNVEKISQTMDQFEKHFEDMDVRAAYMEGAMSNGTSMTTPTDQVDDLIQMVADENGLKVAAVRRHRHRCIEVLMRPTSRRGPSRLERLASVHGDPTRNLDCVTDGAGAAMVHFNLRLRDNIYAEWKHEYINYKKLKKALKKQKKLDLELSAASSSSALSFSLEESGSEGNKEQRQPLLPKSARLGPFKAPVDTSELSAKLYGPVEFEDLLEVEYNKVESAYKRHVSEFADQFDLLRDLYRNDAPEATQESLKNSLVELHRLLNHLNNFALLNYTGFIKILKKHDKMFPTQPALRREHVARLQYYEFAEPKQCREIISRVEEMFADWFCEGNLSVAIASLMTKKEDFVNWAHIYIGIKIGSCLILLVWVAWDSLIVPTFRSGRERHIIDLALTRAYPVYRGIGCLLLLHWLLGVSLYVWRSARINYRYIFELDPRTTQQYAEVFNDATNMTIVFLVNVLMYYKVVNSYFPEEILHRGYYPLILFVYTFYFYVIRSWGRQRGMFKTLYEIVLSPFFTVTFFHTFVGDYLTSTVKVNQDICWSICFFATREFLEKDVIPSDMFDTQPREDEFLVQNCANNVYYVNVAVPLICALPLWWRFLQSLRRIYDSEKWWPNLPNALKYALAQVVALFGIFHPFYTDGNYDKIHKFQIAWVVLFTMSSLYTWVWDVTMDWGLGRPQFKYLGDRQMFARKWYYYLAILADLFLRFSWTLTLIPPRSSGWLPLYLQPFTMVLELFRRTFWSFFRLENEHLRNTQGFRRIDFIPLHYDHGVGDDLDPQEPLKPMEGRVFLMKILLIMFVVLGLSVAAILVEK
ncbi:TPA: hypothetical protein N0F65_000316 [Lagenidium giganteum]|uniref:Uncharacterized protein n=1 Tax=Lagenidium giganteum TaxID=4803 RepID=A0AAV2Z9L8_9STRA|nr:TPA: hypothetical protein N0F65_000316 [Lagenidium giganteum]